MEDVVLAEFDRLEQVYSAYRPDSELRRWGARPQTRPPTGVGPSDDLIRLLLLGQIWFERSGGICNPNTAALTERWRAAVGERAEPPARELADLARTSSQLPYRVSDDNAVHQSGDCSRLTFNAIAKGLIVDRAADAAFARTEVDRLIVNAGGDLVHRGAGEATIGIEDPFAYSDNATPLATVTISNQAVATSGGRHRGFGVGDRHFSHVIDPRTGWPAESIASATVIAGDAATADAVATVVSVLAAEDGLRFVAERCPGCSCLLVDRGGNVHTSTNFNAVSATPGVPEG